MTIFLDTSAFIAFLDKDQVHHIPAKQTWLALLDEGAALLTTSYVLLETIALVQNRFGLGAIRSFHESAYPLLQVVWISAAEHRTAMDALLTSGRRKLSLVDCVSFQIMRNEGVRTAFCFDSHFREQGFSVKP